MIYVTQTGQTAARDHAMIRYYIYSRVASGHNGLPWNLRADGALAIGGRRGGLAGRARAAPELEGRRGLARLLTAASQRRRGVWTGQSPRIRFLPASDVDLRVTPDQQARALLQTTFVQLEVRKLGDEGAERDLGLHPRQRRTETEVRAFTETEMWCGAGDIESIGVCEPRRVPVRRTDHHRDQSPGGNPHALDLDVLIGSLEHELKWRLETQRLFKSSNHRSGLATTSSS